MEPEKDIFEQWKEEREILVDNIEIKGRIEILKWVLV